MMGRMIMLNLSIAMLVGFSCFPAAAQVSALSQADAAYARGDYATARAEYLQALEDRPDNQTAWLSLARTHAALADWTAAADAYNTLSRLGPLNQEMRLEYADALREAGRLDHAVEQYNLALLAEPDPLALADEALAAGELVDAAAYYREALDTDKTDAAAWLGLARTGIKGRQWSQAADAYALADRYGNLAGADHQAYGDALRESGDLPGALKQYERAVAVGASDSPAANTRPITPPSYTSTADRTAPIPLGSLRSVDVAVVEVPAPTGGLLQTAVPDPITAQAPAGNTATRDVPRSTPRPSTSISTSFSQLAPGDPTVFYQSRSREVEAGEGTEPDTEETDAHTDWLAKARDHADNDEWEEAVDAYQQLLDREEADIEVHLEYANALRMIGQIGLSKMEYNRILHDDANNTKAKLGLATTIAQDGELEEAMYLLDQIAVDPEAFAEARLTRAYCYLLNDYTAECWRDIGDLLALNPANSEAVQKIIERAPTNESWLEIRALLLAVPGNETTVELIEEIMATEQQISMILPDDPIGRADALYSRGRYDEARREYEKLVRRDPMDTRGWLRLGTMYRWEEDWEEAVSAYEAYLTIVPDDYEARLRYAQVVMWSGDPITARDELSSLINDVGIPIDTYEQALVAYAVALAACGQTREANQWFTEALIFLPHNVEARIAYAGNLANMGIFEEAILQYRRALKEDPTSDAAKLGLAQTYAWSGNNAAARELYDELNLGSAEYATGQIGKAYTYLWEGDRATAIALADEISLLEPDNPALAQLYRELKYVGEPRVTMTVSQSHDRDDNDYSGINTAISVPLDARGTQLSIHNEDFKLDNTERQEESVGVHTRLALSTPLGRNGRVFASAGFLDIINGNAPNLDDWTWDASYRVKLTDNWNAGIGYFDYIFYDTTQLARNGIHLREWSVNSDWGIFDDATRLFAQASWGNLSDDNKRMTYTLNLQRTARWNKRGRVNYGFAMRGLDYQRETTSGYWDPDNYRYNEVYLDWFDETNNRIKVDGGIGYGFDSSTGFDSESVFRYNIGLRSAVCKRLMLKAGYRGSEAATNATAGPGYASRSWYLTGEYMF